MLKLSSVKPSEEDVVVRRPFAGQWNGGSILGMSSWAQQTLRFAKRSAKSKDSSVLFPYRAAPGNSRRKLAWTARHLRAGGNFRHDFHMRWNTVHFHQLRHQASSP